MKPDERKMTTASIVIYDGFADLDLVILWDMLNRVQVPGWKVNVLGASPSHRSELGLFANPTASLNTVSDSDIVLVVGGPGSRACAKSAGFLKTLALDPDRQLIGSQCSGSLILAAAGLLHGCTATTTNTAVNELQATGVEVVEKPLVVNGNVATAGGCLAATYLASWALDRSVGANEVRRVLTDITPRGKTDAYLADVERVLQEACSASRAAA